MTLRLFDTHIFKKSNINVSKTDAFERKALMSDSVFKPKDLNVI